MTLSRSDIDPVMVAHHAPDFEHVMVDIESMSLSKWNALILSVGMVEFDPVPLDGPRFGARSLITLNIEHQLLLGREVSKSTQKFWRDQPKAASDHWAGWGVEHMGLAAACQHVERFCRGKSRVWAKGPQFDLTNLEVLNEQLEGTGVGELWHYQAPRDSRGFCRENPATRLIPTDLEIPGVQHEPVYDCIWQAHKVWAHWPHA